MAPWDDKFASNRWRSDISLHQSQVFLFGRLSAATDIYRGLKGTCHLAQNVQIVQKKNLPHNLKK